MSSRGAETPDPRPILVTRDPVLLGDSARIGIIHDIAVLCVLPNQKVVVRSGRRRITVHGDYGLTCNAELCVCVGDEIETQDQTFRVERLESAPRSLSAHKGNDGRQWNWLIRTNHRIIDLVRRYKGSFGLISALLVVLALRLAQVGRLNDALGLIIASLTVTSAIYVYIGRAVWKRAFTPVGNIPRAPGTRLIEMVKAAVPMNTSCLRPLTAHEIPELSEIDLRTWDFASDRRDLAFYNRFNGACFRSNPRSLLMIDLPTLRGDQRSCLGYTSVIPLEPDAYRQFRSGEIMDGDLNDGHIDHRDTGFKFVLASVMFVECPYREMFPLLGPKALLHHLALLYHGNSEEDFYILMNPVNAKLQRIFSKNDMPFVMHNRDGQRLFEINLRSYEHLTANVRAVCDYIRELNQELRRG